MPGMEGGPAGVAAGGTELLLKLSEALRGVEDPEQIQVIACRLLGEHLGVNRVTYGDVDGEEFTLGPGFVKGVKPFPRGPTPLASFGASIITAGQRGQPLVVPDVQASPYFDDTERRNYASTESGAFVLTMLLKCGRFVAGFGASVKGPRAWTPAEVALIREVGERIWTALERARAEVALGQAERGLRAVFDTLNLGFAVCELMRDDAGRVVDYRLLEVNSAFERLTGLDPRMVLGRPTREVFGTTARPWIEHYVRAAETGQPERFELYSEQVGRWFTAAVFPRGGDRIGVVYDDITERKHADEVLRASATRQTFLLSLSDALRLLKEPMAIATQASRLLGKHLDVARALCAEFDDATGIFVVPADYCAPGVRSLTGRHRGSDFGPGFVDTVRAGRSIVLEDIAAAGLSDAEVAAWKGASVRSCIAVPLLKGGRLVGLLTVQGATPRAWTADEISLVQDTAERAQDALERARAEIAMRQGEAAVSRANRAKDEFLALLGHELRNPLTPILATIDLMRAQGKKAFAKEREVIERQARHLERLVDDLLDVTRITRGKVNLVRRGVHVAQVVSRAVETVAPLLEDMAHGVLTDVEPGLVVDGDFDRLVQVFSNLLTNAAKYTGQGGRIEVIARKDGERVTIDVRDNGQGIDAELLPQVFDLFRQGGQTSERAQGGLGLGLAIVRNLVDLHGGDVVASSDGPQKGSTFSVRLPAPKSSPKAAAPRAKASRAKGARLQNGRVLVVDDNLDIADVMAKLLRTLGYDVEIAYDAGAALRAARTFRPMIALCDVGLPEMDGYKLARRLKSSKTTKGIVLVAVTGYGQPSDRKRALKAGFAAHVTKPIDFMQLTSLVEGLTRDRSKRGSNDELPRA